MGGGGARPQRRWAAVGPGRASNTISTPGAASVEGAGGNGGPGCGARGRWRGLAGLRDDAPSEARGADGSRAGRRPRAHQAARPNKARAAPGTPAAPQTQATQPPKYTKGVGTEVPTPRDSATASSRLRLNQAQPWRRRRTHRKRPPTAAAPRPAAPTMPSKPVRARPRATRWPTPGAGVAGASGAT